MGPLRTGGEWLMVCNQDTHSVVSFAVDSNTGLLRPVAGGVVHVGSPTCVHFVSPQGTAQPRL